MTKLISTVKRCIFVILYLLLCFKTYANEENDKKQLLSYVNQYHSYVLKNKFESAAIEAQHAYELSLKLYKPSSNKHLIIAEEYALILLQIEKYKQAIPILLSAVKAIESTYGAHDKRLITLLGDLKIATKTTDAQLSNEYALRQTRLYLRHSSNEYVVSFSNK